MNIPNVISSAVSNKHTSGAAIVYVLAKFGCPVLATWFPSHEAQLKSTADYLEGFAVFYGFAASGDGAKSLTKDEANTNFLKKSDVGLTPKSTPVVTVPEPLLNIPPGIKPD